MMNSVADIHNGDTDMQSIVLNYRFPLETDVVWFISITTYIALSVRPFFIILVSMRYNLCGFFFLSWEVLLVASTYI